MIYISLVMILMILSIVAKSIIIYFGLTEMNPMLDYMNSAVIAVLSIKAFFALLTFILGELEHGHAKQNITG